MYEQGRLLAAWQDRLADAIQAQLAALFNRAGSQFLRLAGVKVRGSRSLINSRRGRIGVVACYSCTGFQPSSHNCWAFPPYE